MKSVAGVHAGDSCTNSVVLYHGDCLEVMEEIPDKSIDMILSDLPYGILNKGNPGAKWDAVIPLDRLWKQYLRIIKDNGAIILFGSGMFTAQLMQSQRKLWRYNLVWNKVRTTGFLNAKRMPLRQHEDICVFYKKAPTYNPQMVSCGHDRRNHSRGNLKLRKKNRCYGEHRDVESVAVDEKFPTSILTVPKEHQVGKFYHPVQKPVQLMEWLIRTYTNEGQTVLDSCMGAGSTGLACINAGRCFIGIELEKEYYDIARRRLTEESEKCTNVSIVEKKPLFGMPTSTTRTTVSRGVESYTYATAQTVGPISST